MRRMPDRRDERLDELFAAPPREFTAVRKRLVDEAKAAGRDDEARALARLRRPPASVWAVNQLARREPHAIGDLLAQGAALRKSERRLLGGHKSGDFMAEARAARQAVAALVKRAEAILSEAGQKAPAPLARKISQTLQSAATGDDDVRALLRDGRLTRDLGPATVLGEAGDESSLTAALSASVGAVEKPREPKVRHAKQDRAHAAAERERAAAERERAAAERERAAFQRRRVAAAEKTVAQRRHAVDEARAAVERAEAKLRAAKDALVDAETAAAAARRGD